MVKRDIFAQEQKKKNKNKGSLFVSEVFGESQEKDLSKYPVYARKPKTSKKSSKKSSTLKKSSKKSSSKKVSKKIKK